MPKLVPKRSLSVTVVAARAGLIPASDWIDYELDTRTEQIGRAIGTYAKSTGGRADLAIASMLQDLRHYCDSTGLAFGRLDQSAREDYEEYVAETPWVARLGES